VTEHRIYLGCINQSAHNLFYRLFCEISSGLTHLLFFNHDDLLLLEFFNRIHDAVNTTIASPANMMLVVARRVAF